VTETGEKGSQPPLDFPELESGGGASPADEFANVPSSRRRHPAIALAAAALAVFLIYQIHDDLLFAISHANARDVGDARTLASTAADKLPINQYVRVSGMADRESGVIIDTAGSWQFTQFFRLLGTRSRVFVNRVPDPIPVEQAERDVFVGRLVRFRDLSFAAAIRKHFANRVSATHFFAPSVVRDKVAASNGGPVVLVDMLGEQVSLAPTDELSIDVARPADMVVELPRAKYPDPAAARAAVEQQGGRVLDEAAKASDAKSIALVVTFADDKRDLAMHALSELDEHVRFRPVRATHAVHISELFADKDDKDALKVGEAAGSQNLPLSRILAISTQATVQIPDDALLLREGEHPRDHLKSLVIAAFLLGFAVVNLLALRARG
jgi:hypothetical protein